MDIGKFQAVLLAYGIAGVFFGHFTYLGIRSLSAVTTFSAVVSVSKQNLDPISSKIGNINGRSTNAETVKIGIDISSESDPYNISVISLDLQTRNVSKIWTSLSQSDPLCGLPNCGNASNKVWVVTPTYRRGEQVALLTRVAQALYPVRKFVKWMVIDEYEKGSELNMKHLDNLLKTFRISYILMRSTPRSGSEKIFALPKGVDARNDALKFLRGDPSVRSDDVVYFADDDNVYDSEIFSQMRRTKQISMWPTGLLTLKTGLSSPIVKNGKVSGFFDGWLVNRKVPVDFGMFAISIDIIRKNPSVKFPYIAGYIETSFLQKLLFSNDGYFLADDFSVVEPLANNCTEILTWHTKHPRRDIGKFKQASVFKNLLHKSEDNLSNVATLQKVYCLPFD